MSAPSVTVIRRGREKARTAPWRGDGETALLTPTPEAPLLSHEFVSHCLETLAGRGFRRVVTGALSPLEQAGFLSAGFGVAADLVLLGRDMAEPLPAVPPGFRITRVPPLRHRDVLAVDRAAFAPFWRFDRLALADALQATPEVRLRVARGPGRRIVGYAITGAAPGRGFVQRLAVHPDAQGSGTGRRLLLDGLHWLAHCGAVRVMVNTQTDNRSALALYHDVGFREEPSGLSVLSAGLA